MIRFLADLRGDYGSFDGFAETIGVGSAARYLRRELLVSPARPYNRERGSRTEYKPR